MRSYDLDQILIKGDTYKAKDPYNKLTNILSNTLEKHAPLKSKTVKGNQAPFMNKELSKAIMKKSRLRNTHLKHPSRENFLAYKNIKNNSKKSLKQSKKKYIKDISNKGAATSKSVTQYLRHNLGYKKYKLFDVTKFNLVLPTFRLKQQSLSRTRC